MSPITSLSSRPVPQAAAPPAIDDQPVRGASSADPLAPAAAPVDAAAAFRANVSPLQEQLTSALAAADAVENVAIEMNAGNAANVHAVSGHAAELGDALLGAARLAMKADMPEVSDSVLRASQAVAQLSVGSSIADELTMPLDQQLFVVNSVARSVPDIRSLLNETQASLAKQAAGTDPVAALEPAPPAVSDAEQTEPLSDSDAIGGGGEAASSAKAAESALDDSTSIEPPTSAVEAAPDTRLHETLLSFIEGAAAH